MQRVGANASEIFLPKNIFFGGGGGIEFKRGKNNRNIF
jgi:hypothetical protein